MSTSIDNITLHSRSIDYIDFFSLFSWKKSFNVTFLKRVQSNFVAYEHYAQIINENFQRMLKHIDIQDFKFIEMLKKQKQYVSAQEFENENFFKQYNQFQAYINQFKNQLIIAQINVQTFEFQFFDFQRFFKAFEFFKFTNDDKFLIRFFIFQVRNKITINRNHFTLITKTKIQLFIMIYIFFKFRSIVFKRVLTLIFNNQFVIVDNFFEWIERVFENFDFVITIQVKIKKCKQKNKFFQKYFVEFFMYINDIDYNEIVQKIVFYDNFFIEIKQYLIIVFWRNMNFVVFQKKCDRLKNVYKSIFIYTFRNKKIINTQRNNTFNVTTFVNINNYNYFHFSIADENFMNFSINRIKRDFFIEIEKQHRRENDLCFYCEKFDHLICNCFRKFIFRSIFFDNIFSINFQFVFVFDTFVFVNKIQKNV